MRQQLEPHALVHLGEAVLQVDVLSRVLLNVKKTAVYAWVRWVILSAVWINRSKPDSAALLLPEDNLVITCAERLIDEWPAPESSDRMTVRQMAREYKLNQQTTRQRSAPCRRLPAHPSGRRSCCRSRWPQDRTQKRCFDLCKSRKAAAPSATSACCWAPAKPPTDQILSPQEAAQQLGRLVPRPLRWREYRTSRRLKCSRRTSHHGRQGANTHQRGKPLCRIQDVDE